MILLSITVLYKINKFPGALMYVLVKILVYKIWKYSISRYQTKYETLCAIWYHLYNFKKLKNTHGGVLLLAKLQA